jgi:hypothetical protein
MPSMELLLEAERRGILPPDKAAALNEARRRGLVGGGAPETQQAPAVEPTLADFSPEQIAAIRPPLVGMGPQGEDVLSADQPALFANRPPAPSGADRAMHSLRVGMQGVGRGAANLAGAPFDLTNLLADVPMWTAERSINALPGVDGVELPRFGRTSVSNTIADTFGDMMTQAGAPPIEAEEMSPQERLAYNISAFGTEGAVGSGALTKLARLRFPGGEPPAAPRMTDTVVQPYARDPAMMNRLDTAAGAGMGTAMTGMEQLPEEMRGPITDFLAAMVGATGGAGVASGGKSLAQIPGKMRDRSIETFITEPGMPGGVPVQRQTMDKAAEAVQGLASDPVRARDTIAERMSAARAAGEPQPTTGIASDDTGLIVAEKAIRQQDPAPFIESDRAIQQAAGDKVRAVRPEDADTRAPARAIAVQDDATMAAARGRVEEGEQAVARAEQGEADLADPLIDGAATRGAASETLDRVVVDDTLKPRQKEKSARFSAVDPTGDVPVPVSPLKKVADDAAASVGKLSDPDTVLPKKLFARIDEIAEQGGGLTFKDLNDLRPELSDAIKRAGRDGNTVLAGNLRRVKSEIDAAADRLVAQSDDAGLRAQDAVKYFREEFAPFFAQGKGGKLRQAINRDDLARSNTPPTATAEMFLRAGPGSKEAAADLRRILEIAPTKEEGLAAARQYVVADLAKVVDRGRVNPGRLRAWIAQREDMLQSFPEIRKEVDGLLSEAVNRRATTGQLQSDLKGFVGDMKATQRQIDQSATSLLLDTEPTKAAAKVLGGNDPETAMKDIVGRLKGDEAALRGWKAAVADHMVERVRTTKLTPDGDAVLSYAGIKKYFEQNRKTLSQVFSDKEMAALTRAQKMLEPLSNLELQATRGSPTAENEASRKALLAVESGMKLYWGMLKGGGVFRALKIAMSALPNDSALVARLVERAMLDPDFAVHLMDRPVNAKTQAAWSSKLARMMAGSAAARAYDEEAVPAVSEDEDLDE